MMVAAPVLILVPHPDDEAVGAAAAIGRLRAAGGEAFALYLSDGVPPRDRLWPWARHRHDHRVAARWREAAATARLLGLREAGRIAAPTRSLRHRLDEAARRIGEALDATHAATIWVPAFEGAHQDHDAANLLASQFRDRAAVWEFATYNNAGGRTNSQRFPGGDSGATVLALTADERALKRRALALYESERGNLRHIDIAREAFRPLPAHDYTRPAHPGPLFYARYRWVPFHPRVDRSDPAEVHRDFAAYLTKARRAGAA